VVLVHWPLMMYKKMKIIIFIYNNIIIMKKIQTKITDYYKIKTIYGYNMKTNEWHCMQCGISMGKHNPRQLCRKYYCENYIF